MDPLLQKHLPRWAKIINRGGFCKHLETTVTVNPVLTEAVGLPASVNQIKKQKKEARGQARQAHPGPAEPIHGRGRRRRRRGRPDPAPARRIRPGPRKWRSTGLTEPRARAPPGGAPLPPAMARAPAVAAACRGSGGGRGRSRRGGLPAWRVRPLRIRRRAPGV